MTVPVSPVASAPGRTEGVLAAAPGATVPAPSLATPVLQGVAVRLARPDERRHWDELMDQLHYPGFKQFAGPEPAAARRRLGAGLGSPPARRRDVRRSPPFPGHVLPCRELDQAGAEQGLRPLQRQVHRQARAEEGPAGVPAASGRAGAAGAGRRPSGMALQGGPGALRERGAAVAAGRGGRRARSARQAPSAGGGAGAAAAVEDGRPPRRAGRGNVLQDAVARGVAHAGLPLESCQPTLRDAVGHDLPARHGGQRPGLAGARRAALDAAAHARGQGAGSRRQAHSRREPPLAGGPALGDRHAGGSRHGRAGGEPQRARGGRGAAGAARFAGGGRPARARTHARRRPRRGRGRHAEGQLPGDFRHAARAAGVPVRATGR